MPCSGTGAGRPLSAGRPMQHGSRPAARQVVADEALGVRTGRRGSGASAVAVVGSAPRRARSRLPHPVFRIVTPVGMTRHVARQEDVNWDRQMRLKYNFRHGVKDIVFSRGAYLRFSVAWPAGETGFGAPAAVPGPQEVACQVLASPRLSPWTGQEAESESRTGPAGRIKTH